MFIHLDDDLSAWLSRPVADAASRRFERWFTRCVMLCACLAPAIAVLGGGV